MNLPLLDIDAADVMLRNVNGSNEIGTAAAITVVPRRAAPGAVSIGAATVNTTMHVLDERLQPIAPGETGEIYLGSAHLARGYLNSPALTASRFVAHPWAP